MARETNIIAADGLTLYQVIVRDSDGKFYNSATPAFETFNAANWASYALAITKTVLSASHQAQYTRDLGMAAGTYRVMVYTQAGGSAAIAADGVPSTNWSYKINFDGAKEVPPAVTFDSSYRVNANALVVVASSGTAASTSAVPIGQDISVGAAKYWTVSFDAVGLDSTGWTEMYFAVKRDADADSDSEALIVIKLSNPGSGGDGLLTLNGAPAGTATDGAIVVSTITPDTLVTVTLKAAAMVIPPTSGDLYTYELGRFIGSGRKERIATGSLTVERAVLRATAPL